MERADKIKKILAIFDGMSRAAIEDIGEIDFTFLIIDHEEKQLMLFSSGCVVCACDELVATIADQNIQHMNEIEVPKEKVN